MTDANKEMEVLRGEPIVLKIGEKEETVLRMSIDDQVIVMDIIQEAGEAKNAVAIARMIKIIGMSLKREVAQNEFHTAAQIVGAFNKIWIQNEFDFLLQEVGKVRLKAN